MRIAILGGTGYIGSALAKRATLRGLEPIVLARGEHEVDLPQGAVFERADRMDRARLVEVLRGQAVDTLIDIYGMGMLNTGPVFEAMAEIGGRYVLLSSVDVYSNYGGLLRKESPAIQLEPAKEDDPLRDLRFPYRGNPNRPKGVTAELFEDYDKIVLEEAARAHGEFATTVIRAPMIFGPRDPQRRFAWAVEAVKAGGLVKMDERAAKWLNSYGYVDDVAEAMLLAALDPRAAGRTYNVGQNFVYTPIEWLLMFGVVMNRRIEIETVPAEHKALLHQRAEATDLRYPLTLDTTRIRDELGFAEPTDLREALLATVAYETR